MSSKLFLKQISLITFDVHNVLLTVRNGAAYQYARLAREHLNLRSVNEYQLGSNFIQAFQTLNRTHPGYGIHTNISSRQWWTLLIEYTFKEYQLLSNDINKLSRIIYDEFSKGELWIKHPQADKILNELSKTKILGVISNFDERLESLLEQHDIRQYFRFILTPRNCGLYKPQKEIFFHAIDLAKIKSSNNLCHVGDDIKLDYRAAHTANCHALLLSKNEQFKEKLLNEYKDIDGDHIILKFEDLLELFM